MQLTLFEKVWNKHVVKDLGENMCILYIDKHLIHEVTTPQAFNGLNKRGIKVRKPKMVMATVDHNVPTIDQHLPIKEKLSRKQVQTLIKNTKEHNIELFGLGHKNQGIVHVIGPELGFTQPGNTIVCGDSHTATHGAFGTIAFGIGTSEVEMVLATQCMIAQKPKKMNIQIDGSLKNGVSAKDVILYIISKLDVNGGTEYFVEYSGEVFRNMSMEERMTVCNMSIEMGARGGMIAPDEVTFEYLRNREYCPKGKNFAKKISEWRNLKTDKGAIFDKVYQFKAEDIQPMISYGTNPGMCIPISGNIPNKNANIPGLEKAINYMGLEYGQKLIGKKVDYVFLGSCTNSRFEDFEVFANYVKGKKKSENVTVWLVPGSNNVRKKLYEKNIDKILTEAGFEIREPGCSACLGMNEDKIPSGKYALSVSNRNFEGRQGPGSRTFLASPLTAAITSINGKITDPSNIHCE